MGLRKRTEDCPIAFENKLMGIFFTAIVPMLASVFLSQPEKINNSVCSAQLSFLILVGQFGENK